MVSLAVDGCAMVERAKQIADKIQAWMQSSRARVLVNNNGKMRSRMRYPIGY